MKSFDWMNRGRSALSVLILSAVMLMAALSPAPAQAGFEGIEETLTLDSGSSITTATVTLERTMIRDLVMSLPALDAGDTATLKLEVAFDDQYYTPRGWSDKAVGATDDDGLLKANSSQLDIAVDGEIKFTFQTATNQAAEREIKVLILREY